MLSQIAMLLFYFLSVNRHTHVFTKSKLNLYYKWFLYLCQLYKNNIWHSIFFVNINSECL